LKTDDAQKGRCVSKEREKLQFGRADAKASLFAGAPEAALWTQTVLEKAAASAKTVPEKAAASLDRLLRNAAGACVKRLLQHDQVPEEAAASFG
jgi:hypothetical protein